MSCIFISKSKLKNTIVGNGPAKMEFNASRHLKPRLPFCPGRNSSSSGYNNISHWYFYHLSSLLRHCAASFSQRQHFLTTKPPIMAAEAVFHQQWKLKNRDRSLHLSHLQSWKSDALTTSPHPCLITARQNLHQK